MSTQTINRFIGIMLLLSVIIWADYEVIIGEGSSLTQNNPYDPLITNSGSANLILRSELPSGAGGEILAIYFYMDGSSLNPWGYTKDIQMYLSQTLDNVVTTSTPLIGGTLVFDDSGVYDNMGWIQYNLDPPFNWVSDNLLITMVSELTYIPPGFPPDNYFRYTATSGNLSGWVNRNDWIQPTTLTDGPWNGIDANRPNIKLEFAGTMAVEESRFSERMSIITSPNPFNSSVSISIPEDCNIEIYDVKGSLVADLDFQRANNTVIWSPEASVESGVYFVRVSNGKETTTCRIIYLK